MYIPDPTYIPFHAFLSSSPFPLLPFASCFSSPLPPLIVHFSFPFFSSSTLFFSIFPSFLSSSFHFLFLLPYSSFPRLITPSIFFSPLVSLLCIFLPLFFLHLLSACSSSFLLPSSLSLLLPPYLPSTSLFLSLPALLFFLSFTLIPFR